MDIVSVFRLSIRIIIISKSLNLEVSPFLLEKHLHVIVLIHQLDQLASMFFHRDF